MLLLSLEIFLCFQCMCVCVCVCACACVYVDTLLFWNGVNSMFAYLLACQWDEYAIELIIVYLLLYYPGLFAKRIVSSLSYYYYYLFDGMNPNTILHIVLLVVFGNGFYLH